VRTQPHQRNAADGRHVAPGSGRAPSQPGRLPTGVYVLLLCLLNLLCLSGCERPLQKVFITDAQGRALVLHGVNLNAAAKGDPLGVGTKTREDVLRLSRDWGFNAVRYLVFWAALEPDPGTLDEEYLDRVAEQLDWCAEAGLHVILDMHQDCYSSQFPGLGCQGCVNGAPLWAIEDNGLPAEPQNPWQLTCLQPGVLAACDNFWDDFQGPYGSLQEHFIQSWVRVAERFRDHPAVIGYDLYNEPFPGTKNLFLFEAEILTPFYERLIERLRAADPDRWIFFEPITLGVNPALFPSGLGLIPDFRAGEKRLVYAPHIYTLDLDFGEGYMGNPFFINRWEKHRSRELENQATPLLIGEWGFDETKPGAMDYFSEVVAMADRLGGGWTYWAYEPGTWGLTDGEGNEKDKVNVLVRPYPQRVAGRPESWNWDPESRVFVLVFSEKTGVSGTTEVYVPARRFFPDGWRLAVSDPEGSWTCRWDERREILHLAADPRQPAHTVTIFERSPGEADHGCPPLEDRAVPVSPGGAAPDSCGACATRPGASALSLPQIGIALALFFLPALFARRLRAANRRASASCF